MKQIYDQLQWIKIALIGILALLAVNLFVSIAKAAPTVSSGDAFCAKLGRFLPSYGVGAGASGDVLVRCLKPGQVASSAQPIKWRPPSTKALQKWCEDNEWGRLIATVNNYRGLVVYCEAQLEVE